MRPAQTDDGFRESFVLGLSLNAAKPDPAIVDFYNVISPVRGLHYNDATNHP